MITEEETQLLEKLQQLGSQLRELRSLKQTLQERADDLGRQINDLELQDGYLRYPCTCVRQNKRIGIYTGPDQVAGHRKGLTLGLVSESLSVDKDCPLCHGSGVPVQEYGQ